MHGLTRSPGRLLSLAALVLTAGLGGGCRPAGATPTQEGHVIYSVCASCHGKAGEGMASVGAPAIAGLPQWYVEAQLRKFRTGIRGGHPDDIEGLRMRPMSRQLANDAEVRAVAAYVAKLPAQKNAPTLATADVEAGKASFSACMACHGPTASGNEALKAPPLTGLQDWYLVTQLHKFRTGVRGAAAGDVTGSQMRPMALTLADEQSVRNVAAYISTLSH